MALPRGWLWAALSAGLLALPSPSAGPPTDARGDPLPPGARARMGSGRFRHGSKVNALAFDPDGKTLASAGDDGTVRLWEVASGKERRRLSGQGGAVLAVDFADGGRTLVTTDAATVRRWDLGPRGEGNASVPLSPSGKELRGPAGEPAQAPPVAASPDGKVVALTSGHRVGDCTIRLRDAATGRVLHRLEGHQGVLRSLAFSPDGKTLASGSEDETVRLWDVAEGKHVRTLMGHDDGVRLVVFSPDGKALASASEDGTVRLWDVARGKQVRVIQARLGWGRALAFSAAGRLALGCPGGAVEVWDHAAGRRLARWQGHGRMTCAVAWAPDGKTLASAGLGGTVRLWDPTTGKELRPAPGHRRAVTRVGWGVGGKTLVTAGPDETIRFWDIAAGRELRRLEKLTCRGHLLALGPGGAPVVSRREGGGVRAWDVPTGEPCWDLPGPEPGAEVVCLAFAPDGKLLTGHNDGTVRLWGPARELRRFEGHEGVVVRLRVSGDGRLLLGQGAKYQLWLWDFDTGKLLRSLADPPSVIWSLALSPDGRTVAAGAGDFTVRLWETATGQPRGSLAGHRVEVRALAYSADGRMLASAGGDGAVRVWDAATGREVGRFESPAPVNDLAFAADGRSLATGGDDGTALVWDLAALPRRPGTPPGRLAATELEQMWADLAGADAGRAYRARCALAARPAQAVSFLRTHLPRVTPPEAARVEKLLADLDHEDFGVRDRASEELSDLGALVEPALRKALASKPSAEVRQRVKELLARLEKQKRPDRPPPPPQLRTVRAVEVLECVGTPEARAVLAGLAKGVDKARLTQEARAALRRLPAGK